MTIIHGQSMGGHVAIASLELHPGVYQGALLECGVIDGIGLADLYLAYKAAAEYFAGVPLLDGITRPDFNIRVSTRTPGRRRPIASTTRKRSAVGASRGPRPET